ncbi:MAG: VWA domain-containing protein [Acidobacteria bacterium]|nr:VWA domain-containing protein [Acidobacteriota bacterium]
MLAPLESPPEHCDAVLSSPLGPVKTRILLAPVLVLAAASRLVAAPQDLEVRIVAPENDTYVSGQVTIRAEVTPVGDTAISRLTFKVDGAVVGVLEQAPWEIAWDAGDEFAQHVVEAEVVDVTGRTAQDIILTRDLETAVFRAEVSAVLVYATAVDGEGRYVAGLDRDDFEVYENGEKQTITNFSSEPRPMVVGLLLDTSGSMQGSKLQRARQGALAFIDQIGAEDEAFVMSFDSFPMLLQDLTGNHAMLRESLSDLVLGGATAMNLAVVEGSDILIDRPERRALIVLSDGYDTTQTVTVDQAVEYARRVDTRVYTIGIFGAGGGDLRGRRSFDSFNPGEDSLRAFADGSGGRSIILDSLGELLNAYEDIANELKSQYALAYRPSDPASPGEWREIEIRAKGAREVRTKPGYYGGQ